jgi:hypothetical protein
MYWFPELGECKLDASMEKSLFSLIEIMIHGAPANARKYVILTWQPGNRSVLPNVMAFWLGVRNDCLF